MNTEDRKAEELDIEPFTGKPDFKSSQGDKDGAQDNDEDVQLPDDIDEGQPVGSDIAPEIEPGSQQEAPDA